MKLLKVKVCGVADKNSLSELISAKPDLIGFIFVERSPRYVVGRIPEAVIASIDGSIETVGVFKDSPIDVIETQVRKFGLRALQLHGQESPSMIMALRDLFPDIRIIKTIPVDRAHLGLNPTDYSSIVDNFLLDTSSQLGGGSGTSFDWRILPDLKLDRPYLLAGGISPADSAPIRMMSIRLEDLYAVDINSKFETSPGIKDIEKIKIFMSEVR